MGGQKQRLRACLETADHMQRDHTRVSFGVRLTAVLECGAGIAPVQSGFAPENLTTLAHFSVSSAMSLPKSAGEPGSAVLPMLARRAFTLGSTRPALISLFSLSIISAGVPSGAPMPLHVLASYPGMKSLTVGMSGSASEPDAVVTASARSLPALTCSIDEDMPGNMACTCPPSRSVSAGPAPR